MKAPTTSSRPAIRAWGSATPRPTPVGPSVSRSINASRVRVALSPYAPSAKSEMSCIRRFLLEDEDTTFTAAGVIRSTNFMIFACFLWRAGHAHLRWGKRAKIEPLRIDPADVAIIPTIHDVHAILLFVAKHKDGRAGQFHLHYSLPNR